VGVPDDIGGAGAASADRAEVGDDDFGRLYRAQYPQLVGLARLLLRDPAGAHDAVQEAFVRAYAARRRIRADGAVAYVRAAVVNECRGGLRRRVRWSRRAAPAEVAPMPPEEHLLLDEERRTLAIAIAGLPRRQRECVVLRYWLDLSEAEIASTLRISTGAVKTHAHRALTALERALEALR
jgi:RNA polymerase sigma-70 factor (sigma-E family)